MKTVLHGHCTCKKELHFHSNLFVIIRRLHTIVVLGLLGRVLHRWKCIVGLKTTNLPL